MKRSRSLILLWLLLGMVSGCNGSLSNARAVEVPYSVVAKGQYSGVSRREFLIIEDTEQWQRLWQTHSGRPRSAPPVDFNQSMLVAVFMGEQRTGGYDVDIAAINKTNQTVMIEVAERKPDADKMVTMALTQPYVMVRIPRMDAEFRFKLVAAPS